MSAKSAFWGIPALLAILVAASQAQAWGCYHRGYTHVGYGGVQHVGYTTARGPYGGGSTMHYGSTGYGGYGGYHAGYSSGYHYGGNSYQSYHGYSSGGYAAGGYHYSTGGGGYGAGVYRRY